MVEKIVIAIVMLGLLLALFVAVPIPDLANTANQAFESLRNTGDSHYVDRNPLALAARFGEVVGLGADFMAIKIIFGAVAAMGLLSVIFFVSKVLR